MGYELTNIFRIWIPKEKKVITTREVTFDETRIYNPDNITQAHSRLDLPENFRATGRDC